MAVKLELVRAEYQGTEIQFNESGWFNATQAAERFGKRPVDWLRLDETKAYIDAVIEFSIVVSNRSQQLPIVVSNHNEKNSLVKTRRGRPDQGGGTWLHPDLAVAFARWLDIRFAVWCDQQIKTLLSGKNSHFDWKRLRHEATSSFKVMNDILKDVRLQIGKATASHHYSNEARLINWALTGEFKGLDRDILSVQELDVLAKLEEKNAVLIGRGLGYDARKPILEQYAIDLRPAPLAIAQ